MLNLLQLGRMFTSEPLDENPDPATQLDSTWLIMQMNYIVQ